MKSKDMVTLKGRLQISLNGKVVRDIDNLVVTAGKAWIAARMAGVTEGVITHMAIGTGTTAANVADTTLETEVTRQALSVSGGTPTANVVTFARTFAADDPDVTAPAVTAVTEAGLFNDGVAGEMLARTVFLVVNKGEADTMSINWAVTIN